MANKRKPKPPKNDFEYKEGEVCGFSDQAPIAGNCIASFSFEDDCIVETLKPNSEYNSTANNTIASKNEIITENNDTSISSINIQTNAKNSNTSTSSINNQTNATDPIETKNIFNPTKDIFDNRRTPLPNRATPPIDGETPTIKRTYTLRNSTIRKINELKHIHPDINVCVSSIVDIALDYYHNYILNEGGTQ